MHQTLFLLGFPAPYSVSLILALRFLADIANCQKKIYIYIERERERERIISFSLSPL